MSIQTLEHHPLIDHTYLVTLNFVSELLGSQPTRNIAVEFDRARQIDALARELKKQGAGHAESISAATEQVNATLSDGESDASDQLHISGFASDARGLHLWSHQIKGMIKGTSRTFGLRVPGKVKGDASATTDIQTKLYVRGVDWSQKIPLRRDGKRITEPDRLYERPLRAQTPQGPRMSIAASECLDPPVSCMFRVAILRGGRITRDHLETILSIGEFEGRSGGRGLFTYQIEAGS